MRVLGLLLLVLTSCGVYGAAVVTPGSRDGVGVIAADYWEWQMRENPEDATSQGDHRYDDRLTDLSPEAFSRRAAAGRALGARLDALGPLTGEDAITADVLRLLLAQTVEGARLHLERFAVDQLDGPQAGFPRLMGNHPRRGERDVTTLLARYRAFPAYLAQYQANLRAGLAEKRTAPRIIVERVVAQLRDLLAAPPAKSPFVGAVDDIPALSPARRDELRAALVTATEQQIYPAYAALLEFLDKEYRPAAREDVGLWAMPGGADVYALAIWERTTTHRTPAELHELGKHELSIIEADMRPIAARLGSQADPRAVEEWLKNDPAGRFADRAALLAEYGRTVERFRAALPAEFSRPAATGPAIEAMPAFMEKHAPGAYYDFPSDDGARPGTLYVNTYQPETVPRYKLEALAAHESLPGHHLQVSLALGLQHLPRVRRTADVTAFTEGWGVYAERLADEMGLYSGDRARYGMLEAQAFRAARLVVDTGIHAMKWTREQAIEFMLAHSSSTRRDVEKEIDRYIVWPAQGMAYTVGELEIFAARADAQKAMGPRFSRRSFHDHLLASGPIPLETMRREMAAWARR